MGAPVWQSMSPEDFVRRPEVQARIDFTAFDRPLLEAAIFHATNRVRVSGLDYRLVAENIARLAVFDLPAGSTHVAVRERGGRTEFLHPGTDRLVERQTYAAFAEAAVRSWMNSPGHRANIVNPQFQSLGCAGRPCLSILVRHEQIYAVQVFFTR